MASVDGGGVGGPESCSWLYLYLSSYV